METQNFYDYQESVDLQYLNFLNSKTNWWTSITPTARFSHTDATGTDLKGNKYHFELKERFINPDSFNDIFIEPLKVRELEEMAKNGYRALYVNFFNRGKDVYIWNFSKPLEKSFYPNQRIWDCGAKKYKYQDRYGLFKKDAIHLRYDDIEQKFV